MDGRSGTMIDRRALIAAGGALAAGALAAPAIAKVRPKPPLIIDAQGVPGWDWVADRMPRLAPGWFELVRRSGLTAVATTINEMEGNLDALPGTTTAVAAWQSLFASNPEITDAARERQRKFYEDRVKKGIAAPGERADALNLVEDWDDEQRFWLLRDGLKAKGWSPRIADKVLGENLLRLYREVWGA